MPVCTVCHVDKDAAEFYKRKDRPIGHTSSCKTCRRNKAREQWVPRQQSSYKLKSNYGITQDDYINMLAGQNGVCAICGNVEKAKSNAGYTKSLAVDHCHVTGKVRGLLCHDCNTGIGKLKDDVELLKSAIKYLKEGL